MSFFILVLLCLFGGRTGLMVRASDFGSGDPGSILGRVGVFVSLSKRHLLPKKGYHDLPERTGTDRNGPERTKTDRNGPKRTFVDTETDFLGTETDFNGYRN